MGNVQQCYSPTFSAATADDDSSSTSYLVGNDVDLAAQAQEQVDDDDALFLLSVKSIDEENVASYRNRRNRNVAGAGIGGGGKAKANQHGDAYPPVGIAGGDHHQYQHYPGEQYTCKTKTEKVFLRVHRDDRPQRVLLDPDGVAGALVEQAEELLRREKMMFGEVGGGGNGAAFQSGGGSGGSTIGSGGRLSDRGVAAEYNGRRGRKNEEEEEHGTGKAEGAEEVASSVHAGGGGGGRAPSTVVTSISADTRPAKNLSPDRKTRRHRRDGSGVGNSNKPRKLKGGTGYLDETQALQDEVRSVLSESSTGRSRHQRSSRRHRQSRSRRGGGSSNGRSNAGGHRDEILRLLRYADIPLCGAFASLIEDHDKVQYLRRVKEHMSVLYLRVKPNCAEYYRTGGATTAVAAPPSSSVGGSGGTGFFSGSQSQQQQIPELVSMTDSSSAEDSGIIDFGAGPPSTPVTMLMTDSVFLDLALTGSLGLVDRNKASSSSSPSSQGSRIGRRLRGLRHSSGGGSSSSAAKKVPDRYVVLLNRRSGVPLAVCALKATSRGISSPPTVRIYATKPRVYEQAPSSTTGKLGLVWSGSSSSDSLPLYSWAEIVSELPSSSGKKKGGREDRVRYSIFMASGSDGLFEGSPSYRAVHDCATSAEVRVIGRTDRDNALSGCAVLTLCRDDDVLADDEELYFRLAVAKGIDPALMICFAAFVDETLEANMRNS